MAKGRFFVLDGIDGVGKTTQINAITTELTQLGYGNKLVVVHDPGDTALGEFLRDALLGRRIPKSTKSLRKAIWGRLKREEVISQRAEALLYAASRAQLVFEIIRPALKHGHIVLSDRYSTATLAYQGALGIGRGLGEICRFAEGGIRPDLTILLDFPPRKAARRRAGRVARVERDYLEARGTAYQTKVRARFRAQARRDRRKIKIVSALGPPEEITERIMNLITRHLP